jgi:hypothetical protein
MQRGSRRRWRFGRDEARSASVFIAVVLTTWPIRDLAPAGGLDPSWRAGLAMAANDGLKAGTDVVFTYGPLGFLRQPEFYFAWTGRLGLLYTGLIHLAICFLLLRAVRRSLGLVGGAIVAFLVVSVVELETYDASIVLAVLLAVTLLRAPEPTRIRVAFPVLAGVLAGFEVLIKLNTGLTIVIISGIALIAAYGKAWRPLAQLGAGFLAAFCVGWFGAGQGLGNLTDYISGAREVTSGYSSAMVYETPGLAWQYYAALLAAGVVLWLATRLALERGGREGFGILAIATVATFVIFKEGFVRHDGGHSALYFGALLGIAGALLPPRAQRGPALLALTALALGWLGVSGADPAVVVTPSDRIDALHTQLQLAGSSSHRDPFIETHRAAMKAAYALDRNTLADVQGRTVDVLPWEASLVWAYKLKWRPEPVFQSYTAYTSDLDDRNARFLESSRAPERVLRQPGAIDGRLASLDPPAAMRALFCHYRELRATPQWQVLARMRDRCGRTHPLLTLRAHPGEAVSVPAPSSPDNAVYVRISGTEPSGLSPLRTTFYRSALRYLTFDGKAAVRLIPAIAKDGLLLSIPAGTDYSAGFALATPARTLTVTSDSGGLSRDDEITYAFEEVPVAR